MKLNTLQLRRASSALLLGLLMGVAMPKTNAQTAHVGDILCEGDLIVSPANYNASVHTAKAVVFYVDNTGQHGWAIALEEAGSYAWTPSSGSYGDQPYGDDTPLHNYSSTRLAIYDLDGYVNTQIVRAHSTNHPAFYALDFENGWYLPALGQLNYLFGNLTEVNNSLLIVGGTQYTDGLTYWASTEVNSGHAWYLNSSNGEVNFTSGYYNYGWHGTNKGTGFRVRAAISF